MIDRVTLDLQNERSSGSIVSTLLDETNTPVASAALSALLLTLYEPTTLAIVNSRKAQNVLNANNVTVGAADGKVTWAVQPADMAMITGRPDEIHVAQFTARWASNAKEKSWQILIPAMNLPLYP